MTPLPTPEAVARRAEYEVDEAIAESPMELAKYLDPPTLKLMRDLMLMSWERGAGFVCEWMLSHGNE